MKEVNDKTNNSKKIINKFTIALVVVGTLLIIGILIGLSYAYWSYTATQNTTNVITSDCLEITFSDVSDAINIQKAFPITDEQASELTPYTFKITNKCNTATEFDVNLEVMGKVNGSSGIYTASTLDTDYVAVSFNGGSKSILSSNSGVDPTYSGSDYTATEAYIIGKGKLAGGESQNYTLKVWMDESVTSTNAMNKTFVSKISVVAGVKTPLCKRATTLHTETCNNTDSTMHCLADGYTSSQTITYGSLGKDGVLTTGDAFDCDVNGDGTYNSETERFYYVSDYYNTETNTFESDYATLIYYNNVNNGNPNNTITYAFDETDVRKGPTTALIHLPTTSQWSNVSLKSTTRRILTESGNVRVSGFSYSGYAARLLTFEELYDGCYDGTTSISDTGGLSNKCKYLYENSRYSSSSLVFGSWIETAFDNYDGAQWFITGDARMIGSTSINTNGVGFAGSRPAIDVAKTDIAY